MPKLFSIFPSPAPLRPKSRVHDLKSRLDWGEPALTIVDVRDREQFNAGHIMGALSMPADELIGRALSSLELNRDLYIYGETDDETDEAVQKLRAAGFKNVSELRGGLAAWKAVGYPVEAVALPTSA